MIRQMSANSLVGDQNALSKQTKELSQRVQIDELMVNSFIYDQEAQVRFYELLAEGVNDYKSERLETKK
ncbi:hypothetical protein A0O21_03250 [Streptococcus pantholopis]|uniref:Uncharacterized protein n=2 Tax=Streptococcus pantholopis TaxID=1811193 RepID=A0A172Q6J9_9STRE|nr:hypothetical protein A0O21_03250 [Streptococcus pantholopis]